MNKILAGVGATAAALLVLSRYFRIEIITITEPTLEQYKTRFIEFFPEHAMPGVLHHFTRLIESGVDPAHAFLMVARKGEPEDDD